METIYTIKESTMSNLCVNQKDLILAKFNYESPRKFSESCRRVVQDLNLVLRFWVAADYIYKMREIIERMEGGLRSELGNRIHPATKKHIEDTKEIIETFKRLVELTEMDQ